jgi:hypothetical protein
VIHLEMMLQVVKNKNMAVSMQEDVIDSLTVSSSDASNRQDLASCRT